jgi:DNA-binding transcriptional ArsR family regulator
MGCGLLLAPSIPQASGQVKRKKYGFMATERFNRQFIMLDFEDLDNPEFMGFVRSPAFSTYLVMRRYVWRSDKRHSLGLHQYYAQGLLACALSREKIGEALGGVSARTVSTDLNALIRYGIVKTIRTGRGNIFILGKWAVDQEDNVYYEYFFLDRLQIRSEENFTSENEASNPIGRKLHIRCEENFQSDVKKTSTNNRESNREKNKEGSILSKGPSLNSSTELSSPWIENIIETCSREFRDIEHLKSNLTRAYNLWARTEFDEEEFADKIQEARRITKGQISLSAIQDRGKKMAYFFAVLEDVLGLKD